MHTSLPYPGEPAAAPDDDQFIERLRGLSAQQLLDAMTFLSFWSPPTFTAVLDYCEATDWGWSGFNGQGLDEIELYDPGHVPELTWRAPA